jgi:heat-inducible transcriptional repressor
MLDERKSAILKTVVTEYIETAQPVGSTHVLRDSPLDVSPATVRSDMAALERDGYLMHPHTSAGRVPTDKGYRFFVDHLCGEQPLGTNAQQTVQEFFATAHGALERMLRDTATLLSQVTSYAAVVVAPGHEARTVRLAQLVRLAPHTVMVVVVQSDGSVEKATFELQDDSGEEAVAAASTKLQAHLVGKVALETPSPATTGDLTVDRIIAGAVASIGRSVAPDERVFVGGTSNMAHAFDAVETVRSVLTMLERTYVVVELLQDALSHERHVSIGGEHGGALAECSVVVAPYEVDNSIVGTVGVLGPTRMNYPQALAAVAMVGRRLGREISEGRV